MKKFIYGQYCYEYTLARQDRKTLSLTVMPNMSIVLKCPHDAENDRIELFLRRKWIWLNKQLKFFKKFQKKVYEKEYISGESFLYLGRQYKLIVNKSKNDRVSLERGRLVISTSNGIYDSSYNKKLINEWYQKRMDIIFNQRFHHVYQSFDYKQISNIVIRKMNKRWGSFMTGENSKIILNPLLIQSSKDCIDYVITHELCHMKYKGHDKRFYDFLKSKISNWEDVKEKLELRFT